MLTYEFNDSGVRNLLAQLRNRAESMAPIMQRIGNEIVSDVALNFEGEHDPWGRKWRPLSERTLRSRLKKNKKNFTKKGKLSAQGSRTLAAGFQILNDTGDLKNSISAQVDAGGNGVTVGTNIDYAATHQFGRGRIPARPFMPIRNGQADLPAELSRSIVQLITHHLTQGLT